MSENDIGSYGYKKVALAVFGDRRADQKKVRRRMNDAAFKNHVTVLKVAADPVRIAAALGLQSRGKRYFCPACQPDGGQTPDLSIRDRGFCCFKCGLKGDLLKLVEVAGHLDFPNAVAFLERETGIRPPERDVKSYRDKDRIEIVQPGASWKAVRGVSSAETVEAPDGKATHGPAVYTAFLDASRPVEGAALDWLTKEKGVAPEVAITLGLRFCGREYPDIITTLKERYGEAALLVTGLLKRSKKDRLVPSFWHYYAKKVGFLVIPYIRDGRPVYLKVRPPCGKDKAAHLGLFRFMNTAAAIPCLYNVDALAAQPPPDKVLICEGESDTWTALSCGFAAVGLPGARQIKPAWVDGFRGIQDAEGRSRVYLVPDRDAAGAEGSLAIANLFLKSGLPVPLKLTIPAGKDLTEYMQEGRSE